MTVQDFGTTALTIHSSGELALLVFRPTGEPAVDGSAWDQAVAFATTAGYTDGFDWPVVSENGFELYYLTR